jgi:hypothetical protein
MISSYLKFHFVVCPFYGISVLGFQQAVFISPEDFGFVAGTRFLPFLPCRENKKS